MLVAEVVRVFRRAVLRIAKRRRTHSALAPSPLKSLSEIRSATPAIDAPVFEFARGHARNRAVVPKKVKGRAGIGTRLARDPFHEGAVDLSYKDSRMKVSK